uniref:Uncharacterized protein n=1 Tax=Chelonoidis abingdonii TaxID=106734 RepID=A0A8C0J4Y5_CHEAB
MQIQWHTSRRSAGPTPSAYPLALQLRVAALAVQPGLLPIGRQCWCAALVIRVDSHSVFLASRLLGLIQHSFSASLVSLALHCAGLRAWEEGERACRSAVRRAGLPRSGRESGACRAPGGEAGLRTLHGERGEQGLPELGRRGGALPELRPGKRGLPELPAGELGERGVAALGRRAGRGLAELPAGRAGFARSSRESGACRSSAGRAGLPRSQREEGESRACHAPLGERGLPEAPVGRAGLAGLRRGERACHAPAGRAGRAGLPELRPESGVCGAPAGRRAGKSGGLGPAARERGLCSSGRESGVAALRQGERGEAGLAGAQPEAGLLRSAGEPGERGLPQLGLGLKVSQTLVGSLKSPQVPRPLDRCRGPGPEVPSSRGEAGAPPNKPGHWVGVFSPTLGLPGAGG